jgi:hypothetical protein
LEKKYKEGYVVFYVDEKNQINLPSKSMFYNRDQYSVVWDEARVARQNRKEISITMPNIIDKINGCEWIGIDLTVPRKEGIYSSNVNFCRLKTWIEIISIKNENLICVLGFARRV